MTAALCPLTCAYGIIPLMAPAVSYKACAEPHGVVGRTLGWLLSVWIPSVLHDC